MKNKVRYMVPNEMPIKMSVSQMYLYIFYLNRLFMNVL